MVNVPLFFRALYDAPTVREQVTGPSGWVSPPFLNRPKLQQKRKMPETDLVLPGLIKSIIIFIKSHNQRLVQFSLKSSSQLADGSQAFCCFKILCILFQNQSNSCCSLNVIVELHLAHKVC